jgi:hypothetical protein
MTDEEQKYLDEVTRRLSDVFDLGEVKFKPQKVSGNRAMAIAYISSRHVMDRLDEVMGINGWKDEYQVLPGGTEVECRLSLKILGEWVFKVDVGGMSEQPDGGDRMKAAYSDALKRAAVKFGIGRFLYRTQQAWQDYDPVKKKFAHALKLVQRGQDFIVEVATAADQRAAQSPPTAKAAYAPPPPDCDKVRPDQVQAINRLLRETMTPHQRYAELMGFTVDGTPAQMFDTVVASLEKKKADLGKSVRS